jgi:hypothetical protein
LIGFRDPATGTYVRVDWGDDPGPSPVGAWQAQGRSFAATHEADSWDASQGVWANLQEGFRPPPE